MLTRRIVLATAVSLAATAAAAAPAAVAGVPGTTAWHVSGARNLGPMAARPMTVTLVLAPRNGARLRTLVSSRHAAADPGAVPFALRAIGADRQSVRSWAKTHRLRVLSVSSNRLVVRLSGASTAIGARA